MATPQNPTLDNKRRYLRFRPDSPSLASLDLSLEGPFHGQWLALVFEEGHKGCGLILLANADDFPEDTRMRVAVGKLPLSPAKVRWVKEIDPGVLRMGIEYEFQHVKDTHPTS
jgi:hypothetical protein